jgi:acyl-[acyl-carrier-protein]-phospholipid O-acyltransferase/long-chain-fatty-acid--[acyl-carrier-protein] ligase
LFRTRRFLPLFLTQFLGALNDNLLKNALVVLVTYRVAVAAGANAQILVTLAAGLFILPFFLLSATAGQMADKYDKAALSRIIKMAEIGIMGFAGVGFLTQSTGLLLAALFGMGVHSTFFGPIKYALLPQQLRPEELLAGNAYIEAGTFLAILLGTILGSLLILAPHGVGLACGALLGVAVAGYVCSRFMPPAAAPDPGLRVGRNVWRETWGIIGFARRDQDIFRCILGISWFWLVGATLLAEFAPFVKDVLHADAAVVTLLLTVFSIGIGLGSLICNLLLHGRVRARFVPWAALAISVFGVDLFFASRHFGDVRLATFAQFAAMPRAWRVVLDLLGMAVSGGVYIVPLYAIVQSRGAVAHRARIIAANNVVNSLFMVAAAVATLVLLSLSITIPQVFLLVALANLAVAGYMFRLVAV